MGEHAVKIGALRAPALRVFALGPLLELHGVDSLAQALLLLDLHRLQFVRFPGTGGQLHGQFGKLVEPVGITLGQGAEQLTELALQLLELAAQAVARRGLLGKEAQQVGALFLEVLDFGGQGALLQPGQALTLPYLEE